MKPYYNDPYTTEFEAAVIENLRRDGKFIAVLDKSYFYPTSGGQEHDLGFIGDAEVMDVFEESGQTMHVVNRQVPEGRFACRIDRLRRIGNMQQHTGQHILSAAFDNLFGMETVSSRLGEFAGTIDLSRTPSENEIEDAVGLANRIVREDRPVSIHYAERENIAGFKLRKNPKVEGTIRIVEVKDFDMSPCGGTHCTHTSEIGVILTAGVEKVRGSLTRIEFYCGDRAVQRFRQLYKAAKDISRNISASVDELPSATEKLKSQLQEKESRIKILSEKILLDVCEKSLVTVEDSTKGFTILDLSSSVQSTEELRFVASCVSGKTNQSFAFQRLEGNICYMNLNLATDERTISMIIDTLRSEFGAKGGGRKGFYSVMFDSVRLNDIVGFLKARLSDE